MNQGELAWRTRVSDITVIFWRYGYSRETFWRQLGNSSSLGLDISSYYSQEASLPTKGSSRSSALLLLADFSSELLTGTRQKQQEQKQEFQRGHQSHHFTEQ